MDEKWAFVGKKQKHCDEDDPADDRLGDRWDHVALGPAHRLVLGVVPGKRTAENVRTLVAEVKRRTEGRMPSLITTDEYPPYHDAILKAYGQKISPPRTGKRGRPRSPYWVAPPRPAQRRNHRAEEGGQGHTPAALEEPGEPR